MPLSDACNTTSRHLDNILNIQHIYFDNIVVKYNLQSFNLAQKILLILKPRFLHCICSFLIILFRPQFTINVTILISKLSNSLFG